MALEQAEWNRPRQWKRINETGIATWNVRTLYTAEAMNELVKETDAYKVDIYALQEIRWPEKGTAIKKNNYVILYSRYKSDKHKFGKRFYVS